MNTTAELPTDHLNGDCTHCGERSYRTAQDAPVFHSETGEQPCIDVTRVTITVDVHFLMDDLTRGWNGDRAEMAASVVATLHEVIGDDGDAYPPNAVWTNK